MFESQFRKEIFDAMKWVFFNENKTNLPVYGVPDHLKDYHTSKKDISNGLEVNPQEQFRIKTEDIYSEAPSRSTSPTQCRTPSLTRSMLGIRSLSKLDQTLCSRGTRMKRKST